MFFQIKLYKLLHDESPTCLNLKVVKLDLRARKCVFFVQNWYLTSKDPNKFIGDQNVIVFCLVGYFKIKKVSLDVQEQVYSSNFWHPGKFYDFIMDLGILDMCKSGKNNYC